jgi:predicted Zn-dependent protease
MPKWADARFSYGSVLARISRVPEAVSELRAALELSPSHYRANLLLGRILTRQGHPAEGLTHLQQAATTQPASGEAQPSSPTPTRRWAAPRRRTPRAPAPGS